MFSATYNPAKQRFVPICSKTIFRARRICLNPPVLVRGGSSTKYSAETALKIGSDLSSRATSCSEVDYCNYALTFVASNSITAINSFHHGDDNGAPGCDLRKFTFDNSCVAKVKAA
jgi:hypothetical protein